MSIRRSTWDKRRVHALVGNWDANMVPIIINVLSQERGRHFGRLVGPQQTIPGYFSAPGASFAPLVQASGASCSCLCVSPCVSAPDQEEAAASPMQVCIHGRDPLMCPGCLTMLPPLPFVTLCFCAPERLQELRAWDRTATDAALAVFRRCVRNTLPSCGGYEGQESDGAFLLAFPSPAQAVRWCLTTQWDLMLQPWPEELLKHPIGAEVWEVKEAGHGGQEEAVQVLGPICTACTPAEVPRSGDHGERRLRIRLRDALARLGQPPSAPDEEHGVELCSKDCHRLLSGTAAGLNLAGRRLVLPGTTESGGSPPPPTTTASSSHDSTELPSSAAAEASLIFRGLRARMGLYEGRPTRIRPHTSTGRADYHGVIVNRAARIAYAAASGGQILCEQGLALRAVEELQTGCQDPKVVSEADGVQPPSHCPKGRPLVVEVRDLGLYRFKGVLGVHRIAQINSADLGYGASERCIKGRADRHREYLNTRPTFRSRKFPTDVPKRKGQRLEPGTGLIHIVHLPPDQGI